MFHTQCLATAAHFVLHVGYLHIYMHYILISIRDRTRSWNVFLQSVFLGSPVFNLKSLESQQPLRCNCNTRTGLDGLAISLAPPPEFRRRPAAEPAHLTYAAVFTLLNVERRRRNCGEGSKVIYCNSDRISVLRAFVRIRTRNQAR